MKFHEFKADGSTLAVRTINRYADEIGKESMDYEVFKTAAEMLDKQMLKSLAQLLDDSDTAPREWVMKTIADHDPDTFKKMYGDQEGYLSVMKPDQNLKDDNTDTAWNKYGLTASHKDGKFHSYRHGKLTGSFDSAEELAKHQKELIQNEDDGDERAIAAMKLDRDEKVDYANMMFHGKEIDHNSIDYEMQDYGDMIFELHGAKYIDGTPLTDEELEEFEKTGELIDWVAEDYASSGPDAPDDYPYEEDANDQEKIKGLLQWFQNKHDTYRKDFIDDQIENGIKGSQLEQAVENNDELWELENIVNELKSGSMENAIEAINQAKYEFSGIPGEDDNFMQVIEKLGIPKDTFYFTKDESVSEDESELARLKELSGIEEGADFYGYYKDPKDPEGKTFTYPNNMEFKTPHRSNANARMLLSRIGLEPDFENTGSHLIDDFIKVTTNWLQTHEADKDTNEYDEVEMYHVEANRIKKTHPEVTHVGFN